MAGVGLAVGLAVTLELLPERIDLVGFVLQLSGLGSLVALMLGTAFGKEEGAYAKHGTLLGAYAGLVIFTALAVAQGQA
jgi:hypothetical protein